MPDDVVDLDAPVTQANFEEPTGLTLDDVDDDFNPVDNPAEAAQPEPQVEAPWWEPHSNDLVTIKVDGREMEVPFDELRKGYMRQQSYTQKTTEVANMRKAAEWGAAMQHALQTNPVGTLQELADALGIGFNREADPDLGDELFDAEDSRWAQMQAENEQRFTVINEELEIARMQRELGMLQSKYGDEFDVNEVLSFVQDELNEGRDVPFEQAFLSLQGRKVIEERRRAAERQAKERAGKAAAAKNASQQVTRTSPSRQTSHGETRELSLREIFNLELEGVS